MEALFPTSIRYSYCRQSVLAWPTLCYPALRDILASASNSLIFLLLLPVLFAIGASGLPTSRFRVPEEVEPGYVVANSVQLNEVFWSSATGATAVWANRLPSIVNSQTPGVAAFAFQAQTGYDGPGQLSLVVVGRLDREALCPDERSTGRSLSASATWQLMSTPLLPLPGGISEAERSADEAGMMQASPDCVVSLRVLHADKQRFFRIDVQIDDINDHAPAWPMDRQTLELRDGDPEGSMVRLPLAQDPDAGMNGRLVYSLDDNYVTHYSVQVNGEVMRLRINDIFELKSVQDSSNSRSDKGIVNQEFGDRVESSKQLFLRTRYSLDRELNPTGFELTLIAHDSGLYKSLAGQIKLLLRLTDINDNAPVFTQSVYLAELANQAPGLVPENTRVGSLLLRLSARDQDEGENARITYRLVSAAGPSNSGGETSTSRGGASVHGEAGTGLIQHFFEVHPESGELRVARRLQVDRIVEESAGRGGGQMRLPTEPITFEVEAVDGALAPYMKTGHASVRLQITDVNDETPRIRVHALRPAPESPRAPVNQMPLTPGQRVAQVEAGLLENEPAGQLIALVEASDPDFEGRDMVTCELSGGQADDFRLVPQTDAGHLGGAASEAGSMSPASPSELTGLAGIATYHLVTQRPLDRETKSQLPVYLVCQDSDQQTSTQLILVGLIDVNDRAPVFSRPVYTFSALEEAGQTAASSSTFSVSGNLTRGQSSSAPAGRVWQTQSGRAFVSAKDADVGVNARLAYRLEPVSIDAFDETDSSVGESSHLFHVDADTGELFIVGRLDREITDRHIFFVVAQDSGKPSFSSTASVIVRVLDVNDNAPFFVLDRAAEDEAGLDDVDPFTPAGLDTMANELMLPETGMLQDAVSLAGRGYRFSVGENRAVGTMVGRVVAVDRDLLPASPSAVQLRLPDSEQTSYAEGEGETKTAGQVVQQLSQTRTEENPSRNDQIAAAGNEQRDLTYALGGGEAKDFFRIDSRTGKIITSIWMEGLDQSSWERENSDSSNNYNLAYGLASCLGAARKVIFT
ncbi:unnamed protein product [Protopolystoma xenopodis]|uniref:Cadherin domain-containing protein n=1 Tax=Protopolystoma xenopodis TaxID=117903 RepID=A0A3S4ZCA9_9PLAT|nr:unnamed protein product [Protopolystoma xenopodis]